MSKRSTSLIVALVLLALPLVATASDDLAHRGGIGAGALQASIDPATGKLRQPTMEERRALAAAFTASLSIRKLVPRTTASGMTSVALDDRFMNYYIGRVTEEGLVTFDCVNNADAAASVLAAPPSIMHRTTPVSRTAPPAIELELETE